MLRVVTQNSTYEIDQTGQERGRIRRVEGAHAPTRPFRDLEDPTSWVDFEAARVSPSYRGGTPTLDGIEVGVSLIVHFSGERTMTTSAIFSIEDVDLFCPATTFRQTRDTPEEFCENEVPPGRNFCEDHDPDALEDALAEREEARREDLRW